MRILLKWSISVSVTLALKKRMLFTGLLPPPDFEGSKTYDDSDDGRKLILLCKTCRLWCYNVEGWYGWWDESIVEYVFFEEVCKLCWSCVWNRRTLSFPFLCGLSLYVLTFYNALFFFLFRFFRFTFLNETTLTEAGHMQVSPPLSTKPHQKTILDSPFLFFPNNCLIPRFLPSIISFSFFYNLHKKI